MAALDHPRAGVRGKGSKRRRRSRSDQAPSGMDDAPTLRLGGGPVDAVLVSHDHHSDNLDHSGREMLTPPEVASKNGPVIGFVLSGDELPTAYVSGDNASVDVVRGIVADHGRFDAVLLFIGGAQVPE